MLGLQQLTDIDYSVLRRALQVVSQVVHLFTENFPVKTFSGQVSLAHTCNPSFSGGRDQEDSVSKPCWASS
jgi:hypothetical protein